MVTMVWSTLSSLAVAKTLRFEVSSVVELRAVIGDLENQDLDALDLVIIDMAEGEYLFDELLSTGGTLPQLPVATVIIRAKSNARVTFIGGGPGSNFRFANVTPAVGNSRAILELQKITFRDFHTAGNGAIVEVDPGPDLGKPSARLKGCIIEDVSAADGGVGFAFGDDVALTIVKCKINRASASVSGGVVSVINGASLFFDLNLVTRATSFLRGGAIYTDGAKHVIAAHNTVDKSSTRSELGGNVYIKGEIVKINDNHFKLEAGSDGDMVAAAGGPDGASVVLNGNTITVVPPGGAGITLLNSSLVGADLNAALNLIQVRGGSPCVNHPFASTDDKFISNGGSVSNGLDCASLDHLLDRFPVNLELEDEFPLRGVPGDASPAVDILDELIDRQQNQPGVSDLQDYAVSGDAIPLETLPCGYRDIRGLARPQDGDGDGIFGCDAGAYELQGGADIGAAQSGAYYDFAHSGEGYFAEMLGGGRAVVGLFTFKRDGSGPVWYTGLGQVNGNSIVVDELSLAKGGVFGSDFDASSITNTPVAGFSAIYSDCRSVETPGRWVVDPIEFLDLRDPLGAVSDEELDTLLEEQILVNKRLSQIISCAPGIEAQSVNAYRSGTYYDPARSGEGIFVEVLTDGTVVVIWYTFDPLGNHMWILGTGTLEGNKVTIEARYPTGFTRFGALFDKNEIVMSDWGRFTLEFTGCHTLLFSYKSDIDAYGEGHYNYTRLTQLAGTGCPAS